MVCQQENAAVNKNKIQRKSPSSESPSSLMRPKSRKWLYQLKKYIPNEYYQTMIFDLLERMKRTNMKKNNTTIKFMHIRLNWIPNIVMILTLDNDDDEWLVVILWLIDFLIVPDTENSLQVSVLNLTTN